MVKFGNYFISLSGAQWCSVFSSECVDLGSAYLRAPRWGGEDQVQGEEAELSGPGTDNASNCRGGWSAPECPII